MGERSRFRRTVANQIIFLKKIAVMSLTFTKANKGNQDLNPDSVRLSASGKQTPKVEATERRDGEGR